MQMDEAMQVADWRRQTSDLYGKVRSVSDPAAAWAEWTRARDGLLRSHPQSPIATDRRPSFEGAVYYAYDPSLRLSAVITASSPKRYDIATSGGTTFTFTRFGFARFAVGERSSELELYWLEGYGGGIFLPFGDSTNGTETYGGGRYLLDTVKGADLGMDEDRLVLDFNFSYNPSCSYHPRWVCPLSPPENRLGIAIRAGQRYP